MAKNVNIVAEAFAAAQHVTPERISGCGRVYVVPFGTTRRSTLAAARKAGKIVVNGMIYVGYDNADGVALAKGTAIVAALKAHGVSCYRDEHAD